MDEIKIGEYYKLRSHSRTLPGSYTKHNGESVKVVHNCNPYSIHDKHGMMHEVQADDGWVGYAWSSELLPLE